MSSRLRSSLPWLVLLSCLSMTPPRVRADDALQVPVQMDPCVPIDREKFLYLLGIELSADAAGGGQGQPAASVSVVCEDDALVLTVQDAVTRKQVTRRVEIGSVDPSARTRLLALTVAELVLASWMEVRLEPRPVIEPVGPPPPPEAKAQVTKLVEPRLQASAPRLRLGASVGALTFFSAPAPVAQLGLQLVQPVSSAWALHVNLQGGYGSLPGEVPGSAGAARQSIKVRMIAAALLLALRYTRPLGPVDVSAGLAGLVGFAHLSGAPLNGVDPPAATPAYAPWAGPELQLAAAYPVSERARVFLQLDAGVLALGAHVLARTKQEDHVVAELRGGWLAAALGFDVAL